MTITHSDSGRGRDAMAGVGRERHRRRLCGYQRQKCTTRVNTNSLLLRRMTVQCAQVKMSHSRNGCIRSSHTVPLFQRQQLADCYFECVRVCILIIIRFYRIWHNCQLEMRYSAAALLFSCNSDSFYSTSPFTLLTKLALIVVVFFVRFFSFFMRSNCINRCDYYWHRLFASVVYFGKTPTHVDLCLLKWPTTTA